MTVLNGGLIREGVGIPWVGAKMMDSNTNWGCMRFPSPDGVLEHALMRRLAVWAGDDGEAKAYWLHFCENECVWSLRNERNSTSTVVEFDTLDRVEDDRIDFLGTGGAEHKALWLAGVMDEAEALAAILAHIGRDHFTRRAMGWSVESGTLARLEPRIGGWTLSDIRGNRRAFNDGTYPSIGGGEQAPYLAGITDTTQALTAIYEELVGG